MLQRAALGGYGGGGGPLRGADGRPITDLNRVSWAASLHPCLQKHCLMEMSGAENGTRLLVVLKACACLLLQVRQFQAQAITAEQAATAVSHTPGGRPGSIPAHWGPEPAVDRASWQAQPAFEPTPHGQQQQHMPAGYPGQEQPHLPQAPGWPSQEQKQQQAAHQQPSGWPPASQASIQAGWPNQQPQVLPDAGSWQQRGPQQPTQPGNPQQFPAPSAAMPPQASFPGAPPAPPPATPGGGYAGGSFLTSPAPGVAGEQAFGRLRWDRPYMTASEAEKRAAAQAEFKEALRQQMEEKARRRSEELQRWANAWAEVGKRVVVGTRWDHHSTVEPTRWYDRGVHVWVETHGWKQFDLTSTCAMRCHHRGTKPSPAARRGLQGEGGGGGGGGAPGCRAGPAAPAIYSRPSQAEGQAGRQGGESGCLLELLRALVPTAVHGMLAAAAGMWK